MATTFTTILGPVAGDFADGVTAFNGVATQVETNFNNINAWATNANKAFAGSGGSPWAVEGTALFTAGSGWALASASNPALVTYGRRCGYLAFINVALIRTGATIAAQGTFGDIANPFVGQLASTAWQPARSQLYVPGVYDEGACVQVYCNTPAFYLWSMNQANATFESGKLLTFTATYLCTTLGIPV